LLLWFFSDYGDDFIVGGVGDNDDNNDYVSG